MPPVSHPFLQGSLIIFMNYNDHNPPHVHVKYQNDHSSYRIVVKTRKWLKSKKKLPSKLRKLVEAWVEVHEQHLLEQWAKAQNKDNISIVG